MALTTTTNITNLQEKVIGPARMTLKEDQLVIKQSFDIIRGRPGMDDTYNSPKLPGVTAFGLTEGVDMSAETLVDSNTPVSATEVGVAVELTNKMLRTVNRDEFLRNAGKVMGSAINVKQEQDFATLIDGFGTVVGVDGATAILGHLSAGQTQLRANTEPINPAMFPGISAITTPAGWHSLVKQLYPTGSGDSHAPMTAPPSSVAERTLARYGPAGVYFGTPIKISTNLVTSSNDVRSGVFHRKAGLIYEFMPVDMDTDEHKLGRSITLMMVMDYGYTEIEDGFGREWDHDNTSPTS